MIEADPNDSASIVGEVCHMVAEEPNGPRGDSPLSADERRQYSNLLILCSVHHKEIDDQISKYTVDRLQAIKKDHETWVKSTLEFDPQAQLDDEIYAGYIEEWERRVGLSSWTAWTSSILSSGQPSLSNEMYHALSDARGWILARVWPGRFDDLEAALKNFQRVLDDFHFMFAKHAERWNDDMWLTKKFYKSDTWNPAFMEELRAYNDHVDLVEDLCLELTRAANYVCDAVRIRLYTHYRRAEGVLLVRSGPHSDLTYKTHRVEYRGSERELFPYPGLEEFKTARLNRDLHFGGTDEDPLWG